MSSAPQQPPQPAPASLGPRWSYAVLILAILFVLMPFLFWQSTWFGKPLTEKQLQESFQDEKRPRKIQHALSQVADKIARGDSSAWRWYPEVVRVARHPVDEIRITAAWVMGQDNQVPEFREALRGMLADANPMAARNAALSLVRFEDTSGRDKILEMLRPYAQKAPQGGTLSHRLKLGDAVNPGTLLARLQAAGGEIEARSQVPGTVQRWLVADGAAVAANEEVVLIAPSPEMVWEALRALFLIGQPEDLPEVDRYVQGVFTMPDSVREQARLTAAAIRKRSGSE